MRKAKAEVSGNQLKGRPGFNFDPVELRKGLLILRALQPKVRQEIIRALDATPDMTVTSLYLELRMEQAAVSQHLAALRRIGVLIADRQGKFVHYSINYDRLEEISKLAYALAVPYTEIGGRNR
jgi:DNA-binding transcriptional ArsR family regulator